MNQTLSITRDPISRLIRKIALPASVGTFFQTMYNIVDTYFAGKISPEALSALAKSFPIYFIIVAACVGVTVGGTTLIANSIGEKNQKKAADFFAQTIIYGILVSIFVTVIGLIFSPKLFILMGSDNESVSLGLKYTNIIFYGSILFIMLVALNSSLHADGNTKTYRNVLIISFFLNIILNPLFIFGYGIIPPMGIAGIAVSTVVSQFIGFMILLNKIIGSDRIRSLKLNNFYPNSTFLKDLFFQSTPISLTLFLIAVGNFIILFFVGYFGEYATAGYGAAARFEQIFLLPILGLNTAIISIVGQNFGAKNFKRVSESYFKSVSYGTIIMFFSGILIYLTANQIIEIFTANEDVIKFGTLYLKISALTFPAYPVFFISNGFFMALKKSIYSLYLNIIRNLLLPLPTLWFVSNILKGDFEHIFWGLFATNWIFAISILTFVKIYIKRNFY